MTRTGQKSPGYVSNYVSKDDRPQCYCHGDRHESAQEITQENAAAIGAEYAYVFTPEAKLLVLSGYHRDGQKMIGMFGSGDPEAQWHTIAQVDLNGPEPDWETIHD